jgi:hypothetical protein
MPAMAREGGGASRLGLGFTGPVGWISAGRRYVSRYPVRPGVGRARSRICLSDAAAPTRLTQKGGIAAGQGGGLDRVGSRSLPRPANGRDWQPKLITKYGCYLQLCSGTEGI